MKALFTPGQVGMAAGCYHELTHAFPSYGQPGFEADFQKAMTELITRHVRGDWGTVCAHDAKVNDASVKNGARIMSEYTLHGVTVWIITDAAYTDDPTTREVTTFLRPEDY